MFLLLLAHLGSPGKGDIERLFLLVLSNLFWNRSQWQWSRLWSTTTTRLYLYDSHMSNMLCFQWTTLYMSSCVFLLWTTHDVHTWRYVNHN